MTFDACAGTSAVTGVDGRFQVWVSKGMPTFRSFELAGYLSANEAELGFPFNYGSLDATLSKADTKALLPGWDDTKGYAVLTLSARGSMPTSCKDLSGITVTVKGALGAKHAYVDGDPPAATSGAATTKRGLAYVSGLAPGVLDGDTFTRRAAAPMRTRWTSTPAA